MSVALGLLRAYKLLVSPFFAGSCRFEPSCSDYTAESIRVYGVVSGTWTRKAGTLTVAWLREGDPPDHDLPRVEAAQLGAILAQTST